MTNAEMIKELKKNYKDEMVKAKKYMDMDEERMKSCGLSESTRTQFFYEHIGARDAYAKILTNLGVPSWELQKIIDEIHE